MLFFFSSIRQHTRSLCDWSSDVCSSDLVVVTMENRSFDHFLGWLPNADGKQAGLSFVDNNGVAQPTQPLSGDNTGCPHRSEERRVGKERTCRGRRCP